MATNKHRVQAYLDDNLFQYLESFSKSEGQSVSQSVEKILSNFFTTQTNGEKLDRQKIQNAIALLSSLISNSPVTHQESNSPVTHQESNSPVTHPNHPDTILQNLFGVVLLQDKQIKGFWDGRKFHDDPKRMKMYRTPPQPRVMKNAEIAASCYGQARWNDIFTLLGLMGYPHGFEKWKTTNLERFWVDSNLNKF
jgi:hypothetical protein